MTLRTLLALALGTAWFGWGAPAVVARLDEARVQASRHRSLEDLRRSAGPSPSGEVTTLLAEATRATARENAWGRTVAGLLTPAEREEALARGAALPPVPPTGLHNSIEPETLALVTALHQRYGYATVPIPDAPPTDHWAMVDRRSRARAILGLIQGPGVGEDRAAILLAVTLDLLEAQRERSEIEEALDALLPP